MMVRLSRFSASLVLAGALALTLAPLESAHAQANNDFFGNLFKPPGQVRSGNTAPPPDADEGGSATTRIDRLENQFRLLTGQIEQLQYRNQQLEQQVRSLQGEIDFRLGGTGGAAAAGGAAPRANPPVAGAPGGVAPILDPAPARRSDAFDPNAQAAAPGVPRPLGTTTPSAPVAGQPGAPMDLGQLSGAVAAGGAPVAAPSNSPKDVFDVAYNSVLRQDYVQAGQGFDQFLKLYPNDRAAPDAYYWLGETQFQRKIYKEAAQSFLKVSTDYPNAVKAPDALLRLGQSLAAIGEKDAACATLNAVGNKYPRASATIKQGVEREQKRVGC
ncbi:tol-pal system protein YbgF [Ancylobacter amanitiformis]|uniref:Cell division coordinator CpoB n=1 Tax=Ancylobacter amanitiformis TaxID=217069 RepID=A0ABU0LNT8_9HYPH|nr:tol-pal system protein YbgF [Ancylobacter amanitiformis]MDQ0510333.1 tol-pal system protein YbgF [Ancylobacter amanitiformis]